MSAQPKTLSIRLGEAELIVPHNVLVQTYLESLSRETGIALPIPSERPALREGERYVGAILTETRREHIILLPGDRAPASHQAQMDWAASIGGELPDRVIGALLFATMREEFKEEAYWLCEKHASDSGWAWCQSFSDGYRYSDLQGLELRARAVRRLIIQ